MNTVWVLSHLDVLKDKDSVIAIYNNPPSLSDINDAIQKANINIGLSRKLYDELICDEYILGHFEEKAFTLKEITLTNN